MTLWLLVIVHASPNSCQVDKATGSVSGMYVLNIEIHLYKAKGQYKWAADCSHASGCPSAAWVVMLLVTERIVCHYGHDE